MNQTELLEVITKRPLAKPNVRYDAMHELIELLLPESEPGPKPEGSRAGGAQVKAITIARQKAADLAGVSMSAVLRMYARRKSWVKHPWLDKFNTFDMELDDDFLDEIAEELRLLATEYERLRHVGKMLSGRQWHGVEKVTELRKFLMNSRPVAICPYCKAQEGAQESCPNCKGRGWFRKRHMARVPGRLLFTDPMLVVVDGVEMELE